MRSFEDRTTLPLQGASFPANSFDSVDEARPIYCRACWYASIVDMPTMANPLKGDTIRTKPIDMDTIAALAQMPIASKDSVYVAINLFVLIV